ncbi:MAG: PD-(D/E)XK nuclease family protein [Nitrosomonas sp.]|nr:PD-(D/E)XK nuclease family protein [Nitrosomonas sp.]MDP1951942.1 PD-(D/E)XK nuclease family protein [Nitrosomonas sp.]
MIEQQTISLESIFDALDRGVTVITGNNRLAGVTRQAFEQAAIDKGLEVWPTPDVLPWTAWLQRVWEEAVVSGAASAPELLLTSQQEQRIWEDIVTESMADQPLQQVTGTVRRAQEAWQLMQSWRLSLNEAAFRYNSDSTAFLKWASRFEARCTQKSWLPLARLSDEFQRSVQAGDLATSMELVLIGFDELTPQQQSLLQTLAESGCDVRWMLLAGKASQAARIGCVDVRAEAATVARWVRQRLAENPELEIGIVVPELASQRDIVIHALDEILVPHALQPGRQSVARPYNISLGPPLSAYPIISTALKLLGLLAQTISLEDAGSLLRSPFIAGWEQEASARALLDGRLRETGELHLVLKTLRYHASQSTKSYSCPVLVEKLDAWTKAARDCPRTDSPGQWSERFAGLLKVIGWASGRPLSSEEYQATEAWRELLGTFASLEPVAEPMAASTAVAQLRRMAGERTFQPQTGAVPVQVLGMLEASGLQFDCLWIMGLHDGTWPAPPRPNPFIPLPLQRDAGLPYSSEERELQVSRTMTRRMLTSAAEVMVSFPQRSGDEELRPSPLITDLSSVDADGVDSGALRLWPAPTWRDGVHRSARLTTLEADPAPPLENEDVSGGSAVFKLQAACPFRAFAELRLGARALRQADIGLDAMARGSLMHRVLEKVWHALNSHAQLVAMDTTAVAAMVETMVGEAIDEIAGRYPQTFTRRFREMEAERLRRHVLEWLELEKQRVPFRVVEKEQKHEATAGGVRVQLKIDRIDELADGRQVVIDYKTGEVKPAQWFGERPDEPQLPLYSMAVGGDIAGVLFAQVKAGAMAFNGVAEDDGLAPGVKSYESLKQTREANSWSEVLHDWRTTMERLGETFRTGEASVDPKQYPVTCTYCELKPLCRINELTVLDGESSETEDQS